MSKNHIARRELPPLMALRAFEAAARLGNFTLAAEHLFLTQSAISRHVRNLELRLGVTLFHRHGRRLALTPEGREYMTATGDAFERIAAATATLRRRRPGDILTVSMLPSIAMKWFTPRLADFILAHPNVDLRLSASHQLVDLETDGIDMAIRYGRGDWPGVAAEELTDEEIMPVCSPRLAAGPPRLSTPNDLAHVTLLHGELHEDWRMWLTAVGCDHADETRGPKFSDAASLIQAAIDGLGVALGRTLLVADDLAAGRLVAPFALRLKGEFTYWLVTPKGRPPHPHFAAVRDWLRGHIARARPRDGI